MTKTTGGSKQKKQNDEDVREAAILEGDTQLPNREEDVETITESISELTDSQTTDLAPDDKRARESENTSKDESDSASVQDETATAPNDLQFDRSQIKEVIRERHSSFIVYLDNRQEVRWLVNDSSRNGLSDDARSAISQSRLVASTPVTYLSDDQKVAWKRMIGESLALALSGDVENSIATTQRSQQFILARAKETARIWFIQGSLFAFVPMLLFGIGLFLIAYSGTEDTWLHNHLWFHAPLSQALVFGAIGAQFSILLRLSDLNVDPGAGKRAHVGEAIVRILLGVFAAIIAVVVVQADLILGFINHVQLNATDPNAEQWWIPAIALLGGASERLVPTFLHQIETSALANTENATEAAKHEPFGGEGKHEKKDDKATSLQDNSAKK